jgi:hypothetical protein
MSMEIFEEASHTDVGVMFLISVLISDRDESYSNTSNRRTREKKQDYIILEVSRFETEVLLACRIKKNQRRAV